ncbi:DUF1624 domain-containing protein [Namhaeicola litoreus]|uniref:DUF1624 domain-containing protein n=1 Tax=Namhaeicola litoreus TaxID=1052145 RepID=A0ABW3XZP8_9FLAO
MKSNRIESLDILRGLVMVIMALDHVRDYFYYGSFFNDPTDLETTTPVLFFTRFITHFCAPIFVFLAGTSAFLYGSKRSKPELAKFLFTRGIWLIILEIVLNNLIWTFDFGYSIQILQVIWAIGLSMVVLSGLIYLPYKAILVIATILVVGHNLLDGIVVQGNSFRDIIWYILHQTHRIVLGPNKMIVFRYPIIPWIGLMAFGYCFGKLYLRDFDQTLRKKWLLGLGFGLTLLFFIVRGINVYGDLLPWSVQKNTIYTFLSFLNVAKYPPSLSYLLVTTGPTFILLYLLEDKKSSLTHFFLVFGRVPLLFYFLHVLVIHALAMIGLTIFGGNWKDMILTLDVFANAKLIHYGYPLWVTYLIWIGVILLLYPICKKYMIYKATNKEKWWLSYL